MLSPLIGVPFAWYLMKDSTFLAMSVGLGFACGGLFLVLFLPETLDRAGFSDKLSYPASDDVSPEDEGLLPTSKPMSIFGVVKGLNFVFGTPALRTLSITFIISPVILNSMSFLVQFASERYHWSIADVGHHSPSIIGNLSNVYNSLASLRHSARYPHSLCSWSFFQSFTLSSALDLGCMLP